MSENQIAIIGAGFAGMAMAIELLKSGIDSFRIYEMGDDVGGTWRVNTYPGCACDIPSHFYSFSFEPNPDWSCTYSPQAEIQEYLVGVAEKYGLYDYIRFGTEIRKARFDEDSCRWTLVSDDGESFVAQIVVLGVGGLSRPKIPEIPGHLQYEGDWFHSAQWDHQVDLSGKRVGLIGTGASGAQIVPAIAEEVGQLYVFQRTPPWVFRRGDRDYPEWVKKLFGNYPALQRLFRSYIYLRNEAFAAAFVSEPRAMKIFEYFGKRHIRRCIDDPELREAVTPDYSVGCKRVVLSDDYYRALTRENVELVPHAVEEFTATGVVDAAGTDRDLDVAILATGFHVTDFLSHYRVFGRDDRELNREWKEGAEAYLGVAVAGFPNLFILVGPNTALGHNSIVFMIECQVNLVRQCIEALLEEGADAIEVRPSMHREFNEELQERLSDTVWNTGCESWYIDESGKNTTIWPGYTVEYWLRTRQMNRDAFRMTWRDSDGTT